MELNYDNDEVRNLYYVPATAVARFGPTIARALAIRFADLRAVQNASELVALDAKNCNYNGLSAMSVPVADDCSIIFVASHPKRQAQAHDWATVNRAKIVKVGRHDE